MKSILSATVVATVLGGLLSLNATAANISLGATYAYMTHLPGQDPGVGPHYEDDPHIVHTSGLGVFGTGELTDGVVNNSSDSTNSPMVAMHRGAGSDVPQSDIVIDLGANYTITEIVVGNGSRGCCGTAAPAGVDISYSTTGPTSGFGSATAYALWPGYPTLVPLHSEVATGATSSAARYVKLSFPTAIGIEKYLLDEIEIEGTENTSSLTLLSPGSTNLTHNQVDVFVDISGDADQIKVVWDTTDHGAGAFPGTWPSPQTVHAPWTGGAAQVTDTLTGLSENTTYHCRFYASTTTPAAEAWSDPISFTTPVFNAPPVLGAPSTTALFDDGASVECQLTDADAVVTLVWAHADQGESSITDWENASGGGKHAFAGTTTAGTTLMHTIAGLSGDTEFSYRFFADGVSDDDWSEAGSFATALGSRPAPADFAWVAISSSTIDLTWTDNYTTETGFVIRRSTDPDFLADVVDFNAPANSTSYNDTTTDPSTTYYYKGAAESGSGLGPFTDPIEVTSGDPPLSLGKTYAYLTYEPGQSPGVGPHYLDEGHVGTLGTFDSGELTDGVLNNSTGSTNNPMTAFHWGSGPEVPQVDIVFDLGGVHAVTDIVVGNGSRGCCGTAAPDSVDISFSTTDPMSGYGSATNYVLWAGYPTLVALHSDVSTGATSSAARYVKLSFPAAAVEKYVLDEITIEGAPAGSGLVLEIASSGADLTFTWKSKAGKVYDILTSPDLSGDPAAWTPFDSNIEATPDTNMEMYPGAITAVQAFFVLVEKDPPPLYEEKFDGVTAPTLPTGWDTGPNEPADTGTTEWELGIPTSVGPSAANSLNNCCGTNIASDYGFNTDIWLRSAPIDLTGATSATLVFQQFTDNEDSLFDVGAVRVLKASDNSPLGADMLTDIEGSSTVWEKISAALPFEAMGETIRIEFQFTSDDEINKAGWYIDDVQVFAE